ncbi:MAG: hypothetical protein IPP93_03165 [Chitinophagaceae bacterium]|nr:hypothetical protein [Chitinophagaceae bacterium]MBL0334484.1 hypothetical protein [Chitinophagaceae bacterium]MBL0334686.1 hypothetical protein [Chitinophagaceae bacterium]
MQITCPECGSKDVRPLIADSDHFTCKACGEVFDIDDEGPENDDESEDEE